MLAVDMVDVMGSCVGNLSHEYWTTGGRKIAGYLTGSGGVPWSASQIVAHDPILIDQRDAVGWLTPCVVRDVESGAGTVEQAVAGAVERKKSGLATTIYCTASTLPSARAAVKDALLSGFVTYWVANWNLSRAGAAASLGGDIVAVQYASPTSNPSTPLPGGSLTLAEANADLSVASSVWPVHTTRPGGIFHAELTYNASTGQWSVAPRPGSPEFGPAPGQLASARVGVNNHNGRWVVHPAPFGEARA